MSLNSRGKPLESDEVILNLISRRQAVPPAGASVVQEAFPSHVTFRASAEASSGEGTTHVRVG